MLLFTFNNIILIPVARDLAIPILYECVCPRIYMHLCIYIPIPISPCQNRVKTSPWRLPSDRVRFIRCCPDNAPPMLVSGCRRRRVNISPCRIRFLRINTILFIVYIYLYHTFERTTTGSAESHHIFEI